MPSWRLPAARLELHRCFRARLYLWLALQCACLPLLLFGRISRLWLAAAAALALADLLRARWHLPVADLRFDGRTWWLVAAGRSDQRLQPVGPAYWSGSLLATRLRGAGGTYRLLLWRLQVDAETWRRLSLALRYGVSTVSTGSAARPG